MNNFNLPDVLRHINPAQYALLAGFFFSYWWCPMDVIDAQRTLNALHDELEKYQNLNRAFMNSKQMVAIDEVMACIRMRMKNIQSNLNQG